MSAAAHKVAAIADTVENVCDLEDLKVRDVIEELAKRHAAAELLAEFQWFRVKREHERMREAAPK